MEELESPLYLGAAIHIRMKQCRLRGKEEPIGTGLLVPLPSSGKSSGDTYPSRKPVQLGIGSATKVTTSTMRGPPWRKLFMGPEWAT